LPCMHAAGGEGEREKEREKETERETERERERERVRIASWLEIAALQIKRLRPGQIFTPANETPRCKL
jgi:hypothetical protein